MTFTEKVKNTFFYKELQDFMDFEDATSVTYPWAMPAGEIMERASEIHEAYRRACPLYRGGETDSDYLREAIETVCGTNPVLL